MLLLNGKIDECVAITSLALRHGCDRVGVCGAGRVATGVCAGFSGLEFTTPALLETLGIGLRFDLRLAVLLLLPVAVLAWLPRWNLTTLPALRWLARAYLVVALALIGLVYIIDFGHYAYLGVRINATVLRYLQDAQISQQMV